MKIRLFFTIRAGLIAYIVAGSIFLLTTTSCVTDILSEPEVAEQAGEVEFTARPVALEYALSEMYSLMDDIEPATRASRTITSVELVGRRELGSVLAGMGTGSDAQTGSGSATRSGSGVIFPDSLLYLVNFDEGGFAVLAADESLSSVLAMTSAGSINSGNFTLRPGLGSGISLEELWVEEDEDYLLGGVKPEEAANFVGNMLMNYVIEQITTNAVGRETGPVTGIGGYQPGTGVIIPPTGGSDPGNGSDIGGGTDLPGNINDGNSGVTYITRWTSWVVNEANTTRELMTTEWHQGSPFNDFVNYFSPGTSVGCVATAVMQIIAYNEFPEDCQDLRVEPDYYPLHDLIDEAGPEADTVTWAGLRASTFVSSADTISIRPVAAHIAYTVAEGCDMWYDFFGTGMSFSTPNKAKKYFNRLGYNADRYIGYKEDKVKASIKAGFPALMGGISNEKVETRSSSKEKGGHAWVVNGWMERSRSKERFNPTTGKAIETIKTETQQLVHCNWGWEGRCDGYYVSGVFNLKNGAEEFENGEVPPNNNYIDNYDWWVRTVIVKH